MTKTAVIYARYSSNRQREESIEGQIRECKAFAAQNNLTIIHEYIDRAFSAKTINRPDFLKMIEDSSNHAFYYVIVYTLDRFSRNRYDSAVYKYKLKKNGVRVLSAKEKIADDPSGIILESVIEGCSEYFLADLAQKVKRGMLENVINGKWPGGNIPYGFYLGPDKHLHFNHEQVSGVRLIFSLLASGQKYSSIVKTLNEKGYRTSFNKPWTRNSLSHIARNPIYIGTFNYQGQVFKNYVPPMVSLADFDAVQRMFNKRKRTGLVSPKSANYALVGKIYCGLCGCAYTGVSGTSRNGNKYYYYTCSSKNNGSEKSKRLDKKCSSKNLRRDELEKAILDTTIQILSAPNSIKSIAKQVAAFQEKNKDSGIVERLEKEMEEVQKKLTNSIKAIEQGIFSETIKNNIERYEHEVLELQEAISKEKLIAKAFTITEEFVEYYLTSFLKKIKKYDECKLDMFETFIRRIIVFDDHIEIQYNYNKDIPILDNHAVLPCSSMHNLVGPPGFEPGTNRL